MGRLRVELLGGLRIRYGSEESSLPRKNRLAIAALVLAGPEGLSRDKLADLLWGEGGGETARASLRQALASIRKALGPARNVIRSSPDRVVLDFDAVEVDVVRFEQLSDSPMLDDRQEAARLYRGDLLDGFPLKEEELLAWIRPSRERLRTKAVELLGRLIDGSGDPGVQLVWAQRLLAMDATNEDAHRTVMRLYSARGDDNAALKQFVLCRDALARDLGVAPTRETIALFEAIRLKRRAPDRAGEPPATAASSAPARDVQVGRPAGRRPTITVQPFESFMDDPAQAYLAAGIARDIVSALWRHRTLTVINSTALSNFGRYAMMLDGKLTEADVDYVVSGSVRRWDARIRVDAQLTDVRSGQYIWIDSYDTDPEDLPVMQDRIATMIAAQIEPEIGLSEGNKALRKSPHGLAAWDCYHLGMSHYYKFTPTDNREAERLFSRSLELDPDFGEAHGWWSYAKILSMVYYEEPFSRLTIEQAYRAASRAVEIDGQNPIFHTLLSRVLLADGQYDGALSIMRHAVELNANLPVVYCAMGDALAYQGRPDEAMENFETAIALSSRDPIRWAFFGYGSMALIFAERFEEAAKWAGNAILHPNCQFWAYAHRVAALGHLGKRSEAQGALSELRRKLPGFSRRFAEEKLFFIKRPEQLRLYLDGLSKAGVD